MCVLIEFVHSITCSAVMTVHFSHSPHSTELSVMLQARHASTPLLLWDSEDLSIYKHKTWCISVVTIPCSVDHNYIILAFIHSIGMCRMRRFLAVRRSFFHSPLLCTFSCHPSPPTVHPSSLTSSCHLFLDLPLSLVVPKFIYNTVLWILLSSILCTCPNQHNLFNLIVPIIVDF